MYNYNRKDKLKLHIDITYFTLISLPTKYVSEFYIYIEVKNLCYS